MNILEWFRTQSIYTVPFLMLLSAFPHSLKGEKLVAGKYGVIAVDKGDGETIAIQSIFPRWFTKVVYCLMHPKYLWHTIKSRRR